MEKNSIWFIVALIIGVIIVYNNPDLFTTGSIIGEPLFSDKVDSGWVTVSNTNPIEDDLLVLRETSSTPKGGEIKAHAVWINGRKWGCTGTYCSVADSSCFVCNDVYIGIPLFSPSKHFVPEWGFDFGSNELPEGLQVGDNQIVEGWVGVETIDWQGTRHLSKVYFRFAINVAPKPCLLQPNQLIAAEIFPSGVTVSDSTLRYPTAQWCGEHPPKVYDKNIRTFQNRYDLFNRLKNGESLVVPPLESWIVFTVIDNNPEVPQVCDKTLYYDVQKKICTDLAGIMIVCPTGYGFENGVCIAPVKEGIIRLTMKNTGSQKLYNISLMQSGTTPPKLYNAFSQLKEFELESNSQVVFYANLDMAQFNGTVPFQMMFNTKYSFQGTEYSIVKFTEPLVLNFLNGGIIP